MSYHLFVVKTLLLRTGWMHFLALQKIFLYVYIKSSVTSLILKSSTWWWRKTTTSSIIRNSNYHKSRVNIPERCSALKKRPHRNKILTLVMLLSGSSCRKYARISKPLTNLVQQGKITNSFGWRPSHYTEMFCRLAPNNVNRVVTCRRLHDFLFLNSWRHELEVQP